MPRRNRKRITPVDIANAFCRVVYGKTAGQVVKDLFTGELPDEIEAEDLTEDMVHGAMEDIFGDDYYEDEVFIGDDVDFDGEFYRTPRRTPRPQSAASEYAEWFRIQAERKRTRQRTEEVYDDEETDEKDLKKAFRTLGLKPDVDTKTVKKAFRRLAKKWHPDVCKQGVKKGEARFKEIALAYELIMRRYSKVI